MSLSCGSACLKPENGCNGELCNCEVSMQPCLLNPPCLKSASAFWLQSPSEFIFDITKTGITNGFYRSKFITVELLSSLFHRCYVSLILSSTMKCSDIRAPFNWALEPQCEILMFMWPFGPRDIACQLFLVALTSHRVFCVARPHSVGEVVPTWLQHAGSLYYDSCYHTGRSINLPHLGAVINLGQLPYPDFFVVPRSIPVTERQLSAAYIPYQDPDTRVSQD